MAEDPRDLPSEMGGPGQDGSGPGRQTVTVKIGDKEFQLDADLGAALEAERAHVERLEGNLGQTREELAAATAQWQRVQDAFQSRAQTTDPDLEFYRSPQTAMQRMKDELRQELRGEYTAAERQKTFWADFYAQHEDLSGFDDIVRQMAGSAQYANLTITDANAMGQFADGVRQRLLSIAGKFGGGRSAGARRTMESGGGTRGARREVAREEEPPVVTSITERLRKQAAQRGTMRRSSG